VPIDPDRPVTDERRRVDVEPADLRDDRPEAAGTPGTDPPRPRPTEPPMTPEPAIVRRQVEILNEYGLHLRPAEKFVKLALQFRSEVRVYHRGNEFNGKSMLDLTTLAAGPGTHLELEARGPDAEEAMAALAALVAARFHEAEGEPPPPPKDPAP
jgi:phosphocarrier protein HPr